MWWSNFGLLLPKRRGASHQFWHQWYGTHSWGQMIIQYLTNLWVLYPYTRKLPWSIDMWRFGSSKETVIGKIEVGWKLFQWGFPRHSTMLVLHRFVRRLRGWPCRVFFFLVFFFVPVALYPSIQSSNSFYPSKTNNPWICLTIHSSKKKEIAPSSCLKKPWTTKPFNPKNRVEHPILGLLVELQDRF